MFIRFYIPLSLFGKTPIPLLGFENFSLRYEKPVINNFFSLETLKNIDKVHITWMSYPCMKFDHWLTKKKVYKVLYFVSPLLEKKQINMSHFFFYFRHVKGLISMSVAGENCVLATNHEDNFGVISTNTFTFSHYLEDQVY